MDLGFTPESFKTRSFTELAKQIEEPKRAASVQ